MGMEYPSNADLGVIVRKVVRRTLAGTGSASGGIAPDEPHPPQGGSGPIALGSDHGGYELKKIIKQHLEGQGQTVIDCGTHQTGPVDYPDFARAVAVLVGGGQAWRGIMIDGAGIGSCMAANKVPGVRASMCYDHATANNAREHNDANVLTLGAGLIGVSLAKQIVDTWLATPFAGGRHAQRVEKIMGMER